MEIKDFKKMITVADKEDNAHEACAIYLNVIAETQLEILKELQYMNVTKGD